MFPRVARERWWLAEPELKNRSQAIGLRLAIAYHEKDADGVGQLLPGDEAEEGVAPRTRALLAAMSHAMYNATLGEAYERK
ncbi:hypothetical protein FXN61_25735 [Lentzea sp. PSKA42]|uniref:Uncharacterized protein n=1 Tax=Lentzea indica TaxID=2604800 RepID=A0ABX1FM92_9PSEU|nr:hypothetical protein [Lentzea indica]NKE60015.1 hypothetical protein [Lentzea indica]